VRAEEQGCRNGRRRGSLEERLAAREAERRELHAKARAKWGGQAA
jgi:hypothetical protein